MASDFMLYGANGYTGRLILRRALELGLRPLLAGRSAADVAALAVRHDLDQRTFGLDDDAALDEALSQVPVVLHAAGPFAHTALPMVEACLRTATHYLDVTGEITVFERLYLYHSRGQDAGVMILPGVGFDVVPTDLLAAHLAQRLPAATRLRLAFYARGGTLSRGTATTMVENIGSGGAVRIDGRITRVPAAWRERVVDFGFGTTPQRVTTIPWGDVATAYRSTGIPNVEVFTRMSSTQRRMLQTTRLLTPLLAAAPVQRALKALVRARVNGPDGQQRKRSVSLIWGQVETDDGRRAESRMRTPEGYTLTAMTAVEAVRRVLAGDSTAGFQTPSLAWGSDWILDLEGVTREDVL